MRRAILGWVAAGALAAAVAIPVAAGATTAAPTATSTAAASCGSYTDVSASSPFCADITWVTDHRVASGYSASDFGPVLPVSRQAMAAFLYRYAHQSAPDAPACTSAPYADVPTTSRFCGDIEWARDHNVVTGYDSTHFGPSLPVSRQAMSSFLYRISHLGTPDALTCSSRPFADVSTDNPYCGDIAWLAQKKIASGYSQNRFEPASAVSRAAMAAFLHRLDELSTGALSPSPTPTPTAVGSPVS